MNKIIQLWNQNRQKIIIGALVVVFVIILIQVLNQLAEKNIQNNMQSGFLLKENTEGLPTTSIITGETIDTQTTKSNVSVIEDFIKKCNNKDISGAYDMLTEDCKKVLFTSQENFEKGYYNILFNKNKTAKIENYKNSKNLYTYRVSLYDDILSTGDVSSKIPSVDYITIKNDKININGLVNIQELNKSTQKDNIKATIIRKEIYIDYEIYQMSMENNTKNKIILDTRQNKKSMYITTSQNTTYSAFASEIVSNLLEIPVGINREYRIKYNKSYNPSINTTAVVFEDIVLDADTYKADSQNVNERMKLIIKI